MTMTLNRNTVTAIIAVAILITAVNTYQNPIVFEDEKSDTKYYGGAGIIFELP